MPISKIKDFLDSKKIKYVIIKHSPAYTAQEVAASSHIPGKELAKTVIVKIDDEMAMVVLPALCQINFDLLKDATMANTVKLAEEHEFEDMFPGCEIGAMPPFGNLYDMEVYVAESLTEEEEIAFNAGSHTELIKMAFKDFEQVVKPKVMAF